MGPCQTVGSWNRVPVACVSVCVCVRCVCVCMLVSLHRDANCASSNAFANSATFTHIFSFPLFWLALSRLPIQSYRYTHTLKPYMLTHKQVNTNGKFINVRVCWQRLCECVIVVRLGSDKSVDSGKTELVDGACWLQQAHLSVDLKRCLNWEKRWAEQRKGL